MPTPCYLSIQGKTQGHITAGASTADSIGNGYVEGHENEMLIQEVDHAVVIPKDRQSGQPSGQRKHYSLCVVSSLNKATPLLYNSLASGELLTDVGLKWYRTSKEGKQEHFFTIKLTDAVIVEIGCNMPHCQNSKAETITQLVEIAFSYRKIEWTHEIAGTSGFDDWRKPLGS